MFVKDTKLLQKVAIEYYNDWIINHNISSLTQFFIIKNEIGKIINGK